MPKVGSKNILSDKRNYIFILILASICCILYFQTVFYDFSYDDQYVIHYNKLVQDKSIKGIFTSYSWWADNHLYRPVTSSSFIIDLTIGAGSAWVFHLFNIFYYALLIILLYYIVLKISSDKIFALMIGILFAVHPLHTEAVASLVGRAELFSSIFYLLILYFHILDYKFRKINPKLVYLFSSILSLLALLSKENAITIIGIIVLYDLCFRFSKDLKIWVNRLLNKYLGYFIVIILFFLLRYIILDLPLFHEISFLTNVLYHESILTRIETGIEIFGRYLGMLFLPISQSSDFSFNEIPVSSALFYGNILSVTWIFILSLISFLGLLITAFLFRKKNPFLSFTIIFLIVTSVLVSNMIFPISTIMAERLMFLPSVAICIFIAISLQYIIKNKRLYIISIIIISCLYGFLTISRNPTWKNTETVILSWENSTSNSESAKFQLSSIYADMKDINKTIQLLKEALQIFPFNPKAYNNLSVANQMLGKNDVALEMSNKSLLYEASINPEHHMNRAICLVKLNQFDEAINEIETNLKEDKNIIKYSLLGISYLNKGDIDTSMKHLSEGLILAPNDITLNQILLQVYQRSGNTTEAKKINDKLMLLRPK